MTLIDSNIRGFIAPAKPCKLYDGDGLYLLVNPSGSKLWRFKYQYEGKEKLISLGAYPAVSLKAARAKRDAARAQLGAGENPSAQRQAAAAACANTFEIVAREYLEQESKRLGAVTIRDNTWRLNTFLVPVLGSRPIDKIEALELLQVLRKVEARGLTDSVVRTKTLAGRVFRFGIATGRCRRDPSADLKGAITVPPAKHHAAITDPKRVGELLIAVDGYRGQPSTFFALKLLPLVFVRSAELRGASWDEIDFESGTWRIPGARMKMTDEHIVPLSRQALALLRELQSHTGHTSLLFPGLISNDRPISENTLNGALERLGYSSDEQTPHGFRTIASTMLNELGVAPDLIELQLAHKERNSVRAAYNRAQRLEERRSMMQRWADHLDGLKG